MPAPAEFVRRCPYCSAYPAPFQDRGRMETVGALGQPRRWHIAACPACGGLVVLRLDESETVDAMYPETTGEWLVAHLPEPVEKEWGEAVKVYGVGAYPSAVVACGRTLEAAADARQIEAARLYDRVEKMQAQGLITGEFKEAMNYARLIRNIGAHAGKEVSQESAEGTMRFTQQALRLLFEVPGELGRLTGRPPELAGEEAEDERATS